MKKTHRFSAFLLIFVLLFSLIPLPQARATEAVAQDLRSSTTIRGTGYDSFSFLFDNNLTSYKKSSGNTTITLENVAGIGSLYLLLHKQYGSYTITDNIGGTAITAGEYGFLHEYIDLVQGFGYAPTSVTLTFGNGAVQLSEIYVFSPGEPPEYVQVLTAASVARPAVSVPSAATTEEVSALSKIGVKVVRKPPSPKR